MNDEITGLVHEDVDIKLFFENGFGISIVRHGYSFGNLLGEGLFEIAVLRGDKNDWDITYSTPITDDVVGYLNLTEVQHIVGRVVLLEQRVVVVERTFD
jgi:hypothetical protein